MAINMDMFVKMPVYQKALILLFVIITLGFLFYFFVEMKQGEEINAKADLLCTKLNEIAQLKKQDERLAKLKEDIIPRYEGKKRDYAEKLPTNMEMEALLNKMEEIGIRHGIRAAVFKLLKEQPQSNLFMEVPIEIKFYGTFPYVMKFFYDISHLDRIVTFKQVSLKETKGKEIEVSCIASTYRFMEK